MKTIEVINSICQNQSGILNIELKDASRYINNAKQPMTWNGGIFTRKSLPHRIGDVIITTGTKETNLSEVLRVLESLIGLGDVTIRLLNGHTLRGPIEL